MSFLDGTTTCCGYSTYRDLYVIDVRSLPPSEQPHQIERYTVRQKWQCHAIEAHHGDEWIGVLDDLDDLRC